MFIKREIEGMDLLLDFEGEMVEIDFVNMGNVNITYFINDLIVTENEEDRLLILEDGEENILPLHISKEQILEIEEEYDGQLVLIMLNGGEIIINRI